MDNRTDQRMERGRRTRDRLKAEAAPLFALKGFEGVSTRELAQAGGVNAAAISFHFGGKAGLYAAVVEDLAEHFATLYRESLLPAEGLGDGADREQAAQALREMLTRLTRAVLTARRSLWMSLLIQRELLAPSVAFESIYSRIILPVLEAYARVVALAGGLPPGSLDVKTISFALFAMVSSLSRSRNAFLKWSGREAYSPGDVEAMAQALSRLAVGGLTGGAGLPPSGAGQG